MELTMKQRFHTRVEINTNHLASLFEGTATLILVPTTPSMEKSHTRLDQANQSFFILVCRMLSLLPVVHHNTRTACLSHKCPPSVVSDFYILGRNPYNVTLGRCPYNV